MNANGGPRLICDVDGCLVPPRGELWDLSSLAKLAQANFRQEIAFTLCSGRPATFLEALARQLMITSYCICENGALLFNPISKEAAIHPDVPKEFMEERPDIQRTLQRLLQGTGGIIELGKDVMFSINATDKSIFSRLMPDIKKALQGAPVQIVDSSRSIEVLPNGVNKASGLRFWAELERVDIRDTISIGDADNDLEIIQAAAKAAAPANCTSAVRAAVDYVSPHPMVQGVIDICKWAVV